MANTITAISANKDIDYIQKDFNSSVDAIINYANINFGPGTSANRLWTDFNVDSFSRNWLEIVAFIADVFFFYFDNQATQTYLQTATLQSAVANIASQFGFVPASASSASGVATFTSTGAGVINRGFRVQSSNGQQFYVTNPITMAGPGQFSGNVLQGVIQIDSFTAQGLQNEEFNLTGPNVILDSTNINPQDLSPQVTVNGNPYTLVETFLNSNGTDSAAIENVLGEVVGGGGRVFILSVRADGTPFIEFGDGVFGRKLTPGDSVVAQYRTQGGTAGNIGAKSLTTLIDTNPVVSAVTNAAAFSGGADAQSIVQLRDLIPASLRTLERAVALQDFADILVANFNQVFAASAEQNRQVAGVDVNVYVVPVGNGITQISANVPLKNTLFNFIDTRKMVTIQFQILDAFGVDVLIGVRVFLNSTASQTAVSQSITTALQNYFNLSTGGPTGTGIGFAEEILLKDINNVIEVIPGIQRFEILRLTYRPRVQQNVQGTNTVYDTSDVTIFPNVGKFEWLLGAAGPVANPPGLPVFTNTGLVTYSYNGTSGAIQYAANVDLSMVSPGDIFHDGAAATFNILGVNTLSNQIFLNQGLTVNTTVGSSASGSVTSGSTSFQSFKCFKKILGNVTNLSSDTITDNNLDLSVISGVGESVAPTTLLDNTQTFIPGQYATGNFYLVDAAGNIWNIQENTSNTLVTGASAVNNAGITTVAAGAYKIVMKMSGDQIVFNGNVFNINFNNVNTIFSTAAQFNLIGTLGDQYEISQTQANIGNIGTAVNISNYDSMSGTVNFNGLPDLSGINTQFELIDSSGQVFNIVGVNNSALPDEFYDVSNQSNEARLSGSGIGTSPIQFGTKLAQGFKVATTALFAASTLNLQREGNIQGNLQALIVADSGGLPNLGSVIASSNFVSVLTIPQGSFSETLFSFSPLPTLTASTQYHLVLAGDSSYQATENSGIVKFSNTGLVSFTYASFTGVIQYGSPVNLSGVAPGNYFRDGAGALFIIQSVNAVNNQVVLATGLTVNNTVASAADGSIIQNDRVVAGIDDTSPSYANGEMSRYDGTAWSNSTLGPSPSGINTDMIFSVQGIKSIVVKSNLTPVLGAGATVSKRYYDDEDQISLIVGLASGQITFATNVNPDGIGTVDSVPNKPVDSFVFRTSPYVDDIVNLRNNEIPQIQASDIALTIFGGIA